MVRRLPKAEDVCSFVELRLKGRESFSEVGMFGHVVGLDIGEIERALGETV